jgi:hypothetical protein
VSGVRSATSLLLAITLLKAMEAPLPIGHETLIFGDLAWRQNRFHTGDLLFFDLDHFRVHAIPYGFRFCLRLVEDSL